MTIWMQLISHYPHNSHMTSNSKRFVMNLTCDRILMRKCIFRIILEGDISRNLENYEIRKQWKNFNSKRNFSKPFECFIKVKRLFYFIRKSNRLIFFYCVNDVMRYAFAYWYLKIITIDLILPSAIWYV